MIRKRHLKGLRNLHAFTRYSSPCPTCGNPRDPRSVFCDTCSILPPDKTEIPDDISPRERIPVTFTTNNNEVVRGHITGDPDMPQSTRNALEQMMRIVAEQAMNESTQKDPQP